MQVLGREFCEDILSRIRIRIRIRSRSRSRVRDDCGLTRSALSREVRAVAGCERIAPSPFKGEGWDGG